MQEAAQRLDISAMSVMRLIRGGILHARQVVACAPRLIAEQDLDKAAVQIAVKGIKTKRRIPLTENPRQQSLVFQ
jgi:hypothetical protein